MGQNLTDYQRGFRDATRGSVHWMHRRAKEMNDPHAVAILEAAAVNLGHQAAQERALGCYHRRIGRRWMQEVSRRIAEARAKLGDA